MLFFDKKPASEKPWTKKLWIYDFRTNKDFTLKTNPLKRNDLDEFVKCYNPENRHNRKPSWSEKNPQGRWRTFDYEEMINRDKASLDIFWLKDESLEDSDNLPEPDILARRNCRRPSGRLSPIPGNRRRFERNFPIMYKDFHGNIWSKIRVSGLVL